MKVKLGGLSVQAGRRGVHAEWKDDGPFTRRITNWLADDYVLLDKKRGKEESRMSP
ncbi:MULTISPECIES: hypothetical protein [Paraburkholderia]|uniref:hypothetical protein n=1 Tax=Paraburkholderia TaxID=1822464 RepID=UPI0013A68C17|nr:MULTISPECIES: hypothetical protein [Paraburkholderia]MDH6146756.1 hypothetical protein [Paraburkholderia sp. WSM4179]